MLEMADLRFPAEMTGNIISICNLLCVSDFWLKR